MLKVEISVALINQGIPESLRFGRKNNLDSIIISAVNNSCSEEFESAKYIDIRHEQIFESECTKFTALVLSSYQELTMIEQRPGYRSDYGQRRASESGYEQRPSFRPGNKPGYEQRPGFEPDYEQRPPSESGYKGRPPFKPGNGLYYEQRPPSEPGYVTMHNISMMISKYGETFAKK